MYVLVFLFVRLYHDYLYIHTCVYCVFEIEIGRERKRKKVSFTSSFLIWMLFVSFSGLIALARDVHSSSRIGTSRHPCLVSYLTGKHSSSVTNYRADYGFPWMPCTNWESLLFPCLMLQSAGLCQMLFFIY